MAGLFPFIYVFSHFCDNIFYLHPLLWKRNWGIKQGLGVQRLSIPCTIIDFEYFDVAAVFWVVTFIKHCLWEFKVFVSAEDIGFAVRDIYISLLVTVFVWWDLARHIYVDFFVTENTAAMLQYHKLCMCLYHIEKDQFVIQEV